MTEPGYLAALTPLVEAFELLGIAYHVSGSVASTSHGVARTTLDVDVVADLHVEHVAPLVAHLLPAYYVDEEMIQEAIVSRSSFNLIHLESMFKVDVFVLKQSVYDRQAFLRADLRVLDDEADSRLFFVESVEDVILNKLRWYRLGGQVSERQWSDLTGVLRVQRDALDLAYLRRWAGELAVADLLDRAFHEVGLTG